jgi:hypothetical protein
MKEEFRKFINIQPKSEAFIRSQINPSAMEKSVFPKTVLVGRRSKDFGLKLGKLMNPALSAKELVENIVRSALETEYGAIFTLNSGFDKMVSAVADTIITNPDLRRQALAIASFYISKKNSENQ